MKFTVTHEIDCSTDRFLELMLSTDFCRELFVFLDVPEWEAEQKDTGDVIVRHVNARSRIAMPGPLAKVLGERMLGFTEMTRFDKKTKEISFVVTLAGKMAERIKSEGVVRVEPLGTRCRRVADLVHEASFFGIGGLIESSLEKTTRATWDKSALFMNRWVTEHPQ